MSSLGIYSWSDIRLSILNAFCFKGILFFVFANAGFATQAQDASKSIMDGLDAEMISELNKLKTLSLNKEDSLRISDRDSLGIFFLNKLMNLSAFEAQEKASVSMLLDASCLIDKKMYPKINKSVQKFVKSSLSSEHDLNELMAYNEGNKMSSEQIKAITSFLLYKANSAVYIGIETGKIDIVPEKLTSVQIQNILDKSFEDDYFESMVELVIKYPQILN